MLGGANFSDSETLWLGCNVIGSAKLLAAKPAPLNVTCEIVTSVPPTLVRTAVTVWLLPTWTFPKFTDAGFVDSCPPITEIPVTESEAYVWPVLPIKGMFAETVPVALDSN